MDASKDPRKANSSLEMILITICASFSMKPKQAAALLTNSNQYLLHTVVKGLKGKFEPVIAWFKMLYNLTDDFENIVDLENQVNENSGSTLLMVLNTFKTGFFSHNPEVVVLCCRVMQKLGKTLMDGNLIKQAYDWFGNVQQDGGITSILYVLKKHDTLLQYVVNTMAVYAKGRMSYVFRDLLKSLYTSQLEYATVINDFVQVLVKNEEAITEVQEQGLIDQWLELCVKQSDNDGKHTPEERTAAIALMCDLWILFPNKMELRNDLQTQLITMLKRGSKDKYRPLRITSLCQTFRLMDKFFEKVAISPTLYKNISHAMIENHGDATTREYIMKNLMIMYVKHPKMPVSFVVEPIVKQLQLSEGDTYIYNTIDFEFFQSLASHPTLKPPNGLYMMDSMAKIYLNDQVYAMSALDPLITIAKRFFKHEPIYDFCTKLMTMTFSMLPGLEKSKPKTPPVKSR